MNKQNLRTSEVPDFRKAPRHCVRPEIRKGLNARQPQPRLIAWSVGRLAWSPRLPGNHAHVVSPVPAPPQADTRRGKAPAGRKRVQTTSSTPPQPSLRPCAPPPSSSRRPGSTRTPTTAASAPAGRQRMSGSRFSRKLEPPLTAPATTPQTLRMLPPRMCSSQEKGRNGTNGNDVVLLSCSGCIHSRFCPSIFVPRAGVGPHLPKTRA